MNDRIKFEPYELIADSLITALLSKIQSTNAYFLAAKERDGDARSFLEIDSLPVRVRTGGPVNTSSGCLSIRVGDSATLHLFGL